MRLIRLIALILVVMLGLLAGPVLYGAAFAKPNKLKQLGFDVCNGRPCFMGITLGMPWASVQKMMAEKQELIGLTANAPIVLRVQGIDIAIRPDKSQTYVEEIDFITWQDNDPKIPISSMIAVFGNPCSVTIGLLEDQIIEWININYPEIHFTSNGISSDSTIGRLALSKNSDMTNCATQKAIGIRANPWKGLRGLSYYLVDRSPQ